jgi:hypothetical protein
VFRGQVDPDHQIHDYNPGIEETPGHLFWTIPIPRDNVDWDNNLREAEWSEKNLALPDYHDLFNALQDGPSQAGRVTFDMEWEHAGDKQRVRNTDEHFDVTFRNAQVTIEWNGRTADGTGFRSAGATNTHFAILGQERNGAFFNEHRGGDDDD